jgi:hypothetical protein
MIDTCDTHKNWLLSTFSIVLRAVPVFFGRTHHLSALLCHKIADSLSEAEELQRQVAALLGTSAARSIPEVCSRAAYFLSSDISCDVMRQPASPSAPLSASVADVKYLTELSQIQSRILQQQCVAASDNICSWRLLVTLA